eukprot:552574-Prymnesium_polylepis.1
MGRIPRNVGRGAGKAQTRPAEALAGRELRMNCTSFVGIFFFRAGDAVEDCAYGFEGGVSWPWDAF